MKSVYLSGPISGLMYDEAALGWRKEVGGTLETAGAVVLDPTRLETENYNSKVPISPLADQQSVMLNWKSITTKDRFYVQETDVVLMNLLGSTRVSIGSMLELGWADLLRKPVILVMEQEGNMHDHAMVREMAGFHTTSLDQGVDLICTLLRL